MYSIAQRKLDTHKRPVGRALWVTLEVTVMCMRVPSMFFLVTWRTHP